MRSPSSGAPADGKHQREYHGDRQSHFLNKSRAHEFFLLIDDFLSETLHSWLSLGLGHCLQNDCELATKRESHLNRNCGCADNGSVENAGQWTGSEMSVARQVPISQ